MIIKVGTFFKNWNSKKIPIVDSSMLSKLWYTELPQDLKNFGNYWQIFLSKYLSWIATYHSVGRCQST